MHVLHCKFTLRVLLKVQVIIHEIIFIGKGKKRFCSGGKWSGAVEIVAASFFLGRREKHHQSDFFEKEIFHWKKKNST